MRHKAEPKHISYYISRLDQHREYSRFKNSVVRAARSTNEPEFNAFIQQALERSFSMFAKYSV